MMVCTPPRRNASAIRWLSSVDELLRICDGGRAADHDWVTVIEGAHPPQAAEHVRQVTAEDAPVGVQLIDDDVAEVGEQLYPACVMWQDAGVEHVGIGDDDVAGLADGLPGAYWCVAVVGVGLEVDLQLAD